MLQGQIQFRFEIIVIFFIYNTAIKRMVIKLT